MQRGGGVPDMSHKYREKGWFLPLSWLPMGRQNNSQDLPLYDLASRSLLSVLKDHYIIGRKL